ncbi:alpha/beta fold hydrolase [Agromyces aerolatus]|uniref:alpha/beta fold hydrolase n=1 Tax=Agromyces sp. LY-1074 TaxID=3074080 RepID=UPI0028592279|nr:MULTISPECIES: alpha/beta fold hydrolase [unclassified Agromyces]MDR5701656.1 alpha/beta fold hydrolase [Agromyces sp. LY-1074]MDR5707904.1 alpha/beta fold hydrolase [Agromyces sp. LY-1358]
MALTRWFRSGDRVVRIAESGGASRPVYVLVHGLGMAHEYWNGLAEALEKTGRVLALDLPGFGDSPKPDEPLSMSEAGALVGELLRAEGVSRAVLVGHSTGAQVVTETAGQRPELVGAVVLIGPTVNPRERTVAKQTMRFLQDISLTNPKVLAVGLKLYAEAGPAWYAANLRPMIDHRMELALPRVQAPTLVVRAEHDAIVPRDWANEIARLLPAGRLIEVPGRGHETMVTAGAQVADLIARHARGEPVGHVVPEASAIATPSDAPNGRGWRVCSRATRHPRPFDAAQHEADAPGGASLAGTAAGLDAPPLKAAWWWARDYAYAGRRQLAVLGAGRSPRHWLRGDDALPEVVLLPGVYEHWSFLRPLGERLHRAGYRVRTVHGMGVNRAPIVDTSDKLARALEKLPLPAAGRVVVGHSKGGLIGKHLLIRQDADALGVLGVVAVCTPFGGSSRARLFRDPSVRALLPTDATIIMLGEASSVNARIVSIFGTYDPHVPDGSTLEGATNVRVPIAGHFRVLAAPETADAVLEALELLARTRTLT